MNLEAKRSTTSILHRVVDSKVLPPIFHAWNVYGRQGWNMKFHPSQTLIGFSFSCGTPASFQKVGLIAMVQLNPGPMNM